MAKQKQTTAAADAEASADTRVLTEADIRIDSQGRIIITNAEINEFIRDTLDKFGEVTLGSGRASAVNVNCGTANCGTNIICATDALSGLGDLSSLADLANLGTILGKRK
jgi:hypothetical protein